MRKQVFDAVPVGVAKRKFLAGAVVQDKTLGDRQIRVVVSTPTPDRVKDVMDPTGVDLSAYRNNPIVLADHDRSSPIGTAEIEVKSDRVEAVITFAPPGASAKADEYCALAKAGVLNTVSPGFIELESAPIKGGGYHVKKWELLELSLVSVPCNPEAVVTQRSFSPKSANWKCGASLGLPVRDCDGEEEDVLTKAGFTGDEKRDIRFAAKAYLAYDASNAGSPDAFAVKFARVIDGRLMVDAESIKAARAELQATALPDEVSHKADAVLLHYEAKLAAKNAPSSVRKKSMWCISDLASVLSSLRWVQQDSAWEAEYEDDDSEVPAMLLAAMQQLGAALVAMTQEEVAELLAEAGGAKAFSAKVKEFRSKAGRAISDANGKTIKDACGKIKEAHDALSGMVADNDGDDSKSMILDAAKFDGDARAREIEILRLKSGPGAA